ncbi:hypothetical protein EDC56_2845 [Sinobacterium caligoides]|uniref:Uncharacterized protein n=2 Tax=Sinobacterium caligoides TaxID=933926 RepID=A0A3N2DK97_9GAMM|nr:hypothetical protein EDC56_2845 [Sinobacterium caligoides]
MNITEKYLETIKSTSEWLTISEWAVKVGEQYPDLLAKAEIEACNQANDTTGVREIAARISSAISRGAYVNDLDIDASERPRKVRYATAEEIKQHEAEEVEDDVAPLRRDEIIKRDLACLTTQESYRITELETLAKLLKQFFSLDFEVDHAQALLNNHAHGKHHPDNLQLLLKIHNGKKNSNNWQRFTIDEQLDYIRVAVRLQGIIASRLSVEMVGEVLESLLERLKKVY